MVGSKNEQGVPLMLQLASRGWVCVSADYRLAPRATFPSRSST
jgi:acetyl esterase/lipase